MEYQRLVITKSKRRNNKYLDNGSWRQISRDLHLCHSYPITLFSLFRIPSESNFQNESGRGNVNAKMPLWSGSASVLVRNDGFQSVHDQSVHFWSESGTSMRSVSGCRRIRCGEERDSCSCLCRSHFHSQPGTSLWRQSDEGTYL